MNTGLDQYMDIFKDAVEDSAAKLTKSFEKSYVRGHYRKKESYLRSMIFPTKGMRL